MYIYDLIFDWWLDLVFCAGGDVTTSGDGRLLIAELGVTALLLGGVVVGVKILTRLETRRGGVKSCSFGFFTDFSGSRSLTTSLSLTKYAIFPKFLASFIS